MREYAKQKEAVRQGMSFCCLRVEMLINSYPPLLSGKRRRLEDVDPGNNVQSDIHRTREPSVPPPTTQEAGDSKYDENIAQAQVLTNEILASLKARLAGEHSNEQRLRPQCLHSDRVRSASSNAQHGRTRTGWVSKKSYRILPAQMLIQGILLPGQMLDRR
jgi:hypothetical protein